VCFSPQADVVVGAVVVGVGVDAVRHVTAPRQIPIATLPLLLGAHQLTEAFVWWGLYGDVSESVERIATWIYLLVALAVVPFYVPLAVGFVERSAARRRVIGVFALSGLVVAVALGSAMFRGPIHAAIEGHHVSYELDGVHAGGEWTALYVVATCGALLACSYRDIAAIGALNFVAVPVLAWLTMTGFISLWCFWAAIVSVLIACHLRRPERAPMPPKPDFVRIGPRSTRV
jgi:hypothetical protein